jgi:hypothetical protein
LPSGDTLYVDLHASVTIMQHGQSKHDEFILYLPVLVNSRLPAIVNKAFAEFVTSM